MSTDPATQGPNMPKRILLDIDETVADLWGHLENWMGLHMDVKCEGENPMDVARNNWGPDFWNMIDESFWASVPLYPWAEQLFSELSKVAAVYYCSSPPNEAVAFAGRVQWIKKHRGPTFRRYVLGNTKWLCANQDAVLVDDYVANCNLFLKHGGRAVIFPSRAFALSKPPAELVGDVVKEVAWALELQPPETLSDSVAQEHG